VNRQEPGRPVSRSGNERLVLMNQFLRSPKLLLGASSRPALLARRAKVLGTADRRHRGGTRKGA
jgi:hypothetical protein